MKGVLQLPAYRRLLVAYTLNELAWSVGSLALTVLVYRHTHSAVGTAAYFLCAQFFPALVVPALVARIDRRPARVVLPVLYGIEMVAFLALAWLTGRFSVAPALAISLLDGVMALAARATARTATADVLGPAGLLPEGNALTNAAFSVCFMAAPAIAGVAVGVAGAGPTLVAVAGTFALIALILLGTPGLPEPSSSRAEASGRLSAAVHHLRERPALRMLMLLQAAAVLFFTISVPVEIVLARQSLHTGDAGYGALLAAWGVGAIAGSGIYARWRRLPARALIAGGAVALGAGFLLMAASPGLGLALAGSVIAGGGNGVEAVAARTALQELVEERWMGMMMALNESILQAMPGGGIVIGGTIAALAGPRPAMAVAGAGALGIAAAAGTLLRPRAPGTAGRPGVSSGCGTPTDDRSTARSAASG